MATAPLPPPQPSLLELIDAYRAKHHLTDSQFGSMANREPALVSSLRKGRQCGPRIEEKILAFLKKPPPYRSGRHAAHAAAYRRVKAANIKSEGAARAFRETDPVERAKTYLQRNGFRVFAAVVVNPALDGWVVGCKPAPLNDNELIDMARRRGWAE